jgi:hypothetical protein
MYVVAQRVSSRTYFKQILCVSRTNKSQGKLRNKSFIIVNKTRRSQEYINATSLPITMYTNASTHQ